jgi:glycerophosphoryl diester phosphodiesterase
MSWPQRAARRPWIYGHRGVRDGETENTLPAFETALAQGADGIEFDVRFNYEGAIVVFHDESLERMTGGADTRALFDIPLAELQSIDLLDGGKIPLLKDVLSWAACRRTYLNIELKPQVNNAGRLATAVMRELEVCADVELKSRVLLSSFATEVLVWAHEQKPWVPFAQLIGPDAPEAFLDPRAVGQGMHPHCTMVSVFGMDLVRASRVFINVWTVNECAMAQYLDSIKVDGLITDYPGRIRNSFE